MTETTPVTFPDGTTLRVLAHRARAHDFTTWEADFIRALMRFVEPGVVVYDVGAEEGEFSALVASKGASVHLFEPAPGVWPNIRAVFEANGLHPDGVWHGFVGSRPAGDPDRVHEIGTPWPLAADGPLQTESAFACINERPDLPCVTLDDYRGAHLAQHPDLTGLQPDIIMCDVEGAEVLVLQGAQATLSRIRPLVFLSLHPPSFIARFGDPRDPEHAQLQQDHVFRCIAAHGYGMRFLGHDHESHWLFYPAEQHAEVVRKMEGR